MCGRPCAGRRCAGAAAWAHSGGGADGPESGVISKGIRRQHSVCWAGILFASVSPTGSGTLGLRELTIPANKNTPAWHPSMLEILRSSIYEDVQDVYPLSLTQRASCLSDSSTLFIGSIIAVYFGVAAALPRVTRRGHSVLQPGRHRGQLSGSRGSGSASNTFANLADGVCRAAGQTLPVLRRFRSRPA
jgi:hypothetical protein